MDAGRSRAKLAFLEDQIRSNERIWSGFRSIEIAIIGSRSLGELIDVLVSRLRATFPNVDCATLACLDPEYEMTRLLESVEGSESWRDAFVRISEESLNEIVAGRRRPILDSCDDKLQALLFPHFKSQLGSYAAAPLVFQDRLIGVLNQASRNPLHFTTGRATDLLEHLAAVTAVCIDNSISHERLKHAGLTDPLTGIFNRRFFEQRINEEIERWRRRGNTLACMLVDIDKFKKINDNYGHQTGDQVLQKVARILGRDLRTCDVLARYGGEEFILLLPDTPLHNAGEIAERLRIKIRDLAFFDNHDERIKVTISVGLAGLSADPDSKDEPVDQWLIRNADLALYRAKQNGRNRVEIAE